MKTSKKKIRLVTLLELLIAMTLTSLILMALTFFYQQVTIIGIEADKVREEGFHIRYMESRLMEILTKVVANNDKSGEFVFFSLENDALGLTGSQGLVFTFDNGVCFDRLFSNYVFGRLLLDTKGNLLLFYWPTFKRLKNKNIEIPVKKEILLTGVESLTFEFFVPPLKSKENNKGELTPLTWHRQLWLQEFNIIPIMVKMVITISETHDKQVFVFPLAKNKAHIIYP